MKSNLTKKTTAIVIALSILIISESIWLVNSLNNKSTGGEKKLPQKVAVQKTLPVVKLALSGPRKARVGEELPVTLSLQAEKDFVADGMDLVLNYDPQALKLASKSQVKVSQTLFKTVGRNLIEPEKGRVVVSLLDLATGTASGVKVSKGKSDRLLTITFMALAPGATQVSLEIPQATKAAGSKIVEAKTGKQLPFEKQDLSIIVAE